MSTSVPAAPLEEKVAVLKSSEKQQSQLALNLAGAALSSESNGLLECGWSFERAGCVSQIWQLQG